MSGARRNLSAAPGRFWREAHACRVVENVCCEVSAPRGNPADARAMPCDRECQADSSTYWRLFFQLEL